MSGSNYPTRHLSFLFIFSLFFFLSFPSVFFLSSQAHLPDPLLPPSFLCIHPKPHCSHVVLIPCPASSTCLHPTCPVLPSSPLVPSLSPRPRRCHPTPITQTVLSCASPHHPVVHTMHWCLHAVPCYIPPFALTCPHHRPHHYGQCHRRPHSSTYSYRGNPSHSRLVPSTEVAPHPRHRRCTQPLYQPRPPSI